MPDNGQVKWLSKIKVYWRRLPSKNQRNVPHHPTHPYTHCYTHIHFQSKKKNVFLSLDTQYFFYRSYCPIKKKKKLRYSCIYIGKLSQIGTSLWCTQYIYSQCQRSRKQKSSYDCDNRSFLFIRNSLWGKIKSSKSTCQ